MAAAEAAANQWYGLVLAMNTATILKGKLLPASGLLAQMLATPQNFDATSVRKLDEGFMSTDPPTPVERAFNLIRVGQFALDIACDFVAYGSTTIADAIYDAADRLVLVNPGSGPNTPTFDTLAAVVRVPAADIEAEAARVEAEAREQAAKAPPTSTSESSNPDEPDTSSLESEDSDIENNADNESDE